MKKTGRFFFLWTLGLCLSLSFMADAADLNKTSGQSPLKKASIQDKTPLRATYPAVTYFDYGDPINEEQLHLELINRARKNPPGEAARLGIDLFEGISAGEISSDPVQPLTFNAMLLDAARAHSQDMLRENYFSHSSLTGESPFDRMKTAGYDYSTAGENIAWTGSTSPVMDMAQASMQLHSNLFRLFAD
ncbi:MAG: CAP domain-containing protein [Thermodesulfobacteriota bacterium]|nr:CAP domain-containing protein [Thermodesulfobacteriota bacterium]